MTTTTATTTSTMNFPPAVGAFNAAAALVAFSTFSTCVLLLLLLFFCVSVRYINTSHCDHMRGETEKKRLAHTNTRLSRFLAPAQKTRKENVENGKFAVAPHQLHMHIYIMCRILLALHAISHTGSTHNVQYIECVFIIFRCCWWWWQLMYNRFSNSMYACCCCCCSLYPRCCVVVFRLACVRFFSSSPFAFRLSRSTRFWRRLLVCVWLFECPLSSAMMISAQ